MLNSTSTGEDLLIKREQAKGSQFTLRGILGLEYEDIMDIFQKAEDE